MTDYPTQLKIALSILFSLPAIFVISSMWGLPIERSNLVLVGYWRYWMALPLAGMLLKEVVKG